MEYKLSPSILSADFCNLEEGIRQTEENGAVYLHFDVMDGNGTTFGSITKDTLFEMKVVIPRRDQIKSFEEMVQPIEQKIRVAEQENRELTKLRDWLLPMLMNGQATVE